MSEERGLVGTIVDDVGETYQRMLWQDAGFTPPESATPAIGGPEIGAPDISGPDIGAPDASFAPEPDVMPPGGGGAAQDFTPIEAPIIDADYEEIQPPQAIEGPADPGPEISGPDIGAPEGPDMG